MRVIDAPDRRMILISMFSVPRLIEVRASSFPETIVFVNLFYLFIGYACYLQLWDFEYLPFLAPTFRRPSLGFPMGHCWGVAKDLGERSSVTEVQGLISTASPASVSIICLLDSSHCVRVLIFSVMCKHVISSP